MARLRDRIVAGLAALERRFGFGTRRGIVNATVAVAVACALLALARGQDVNWDLRNYHLHNAWSWLQGRLGVDLAPAQMQSYFVPALDVPYYLLVRHAPAPLAGLLLGLLHGLAFLPAAWIARRALAGDRRCDWLAPVLGLAGLASAAFLSELGNTMGDNSTAALVLGAVALALPDEGGRWRTAPLLLGGALLGAAVAFKLTNAIYAFALGLALLAAPAPWRSRLRAAAGVALAALLVFALLAGPWLYRVWHVFGNPLFPQFNAGFGAPLASPVAVADMRWLPHGWGEAVLRPLLFTANPYLVSEIALLQLTWAVLYVAALAAGVRWLLRLRGAHRRVGPVAEGAGVRRVVGVFFFVAFVVWLAVFSIHRYLVVLELLAPLMLWLLLQYLLPARLAGRIAAAVIALCALVAVAGWNDWGHAGWARDAFRVQAPPARTGTVLLVGSEPQAWLLPWLPPGPVYASVGSNFPESPAYAERIRAQVHAGGEAAAILPVLVDRRVESIDRRNRWAGRLGLDAGDCPLLHWLARRSRSLRLVEPAQSSSGRCELAQAADRVTDIAGGNQAILEQAGAVLARYGLALDRDSCIVREAWIGAQANPYHWCRVVAPG